MTSSLPSNNMMLCGWRTRSMFDRYNTIDEADLAAAVAKQFGNGIGRRQDFHARSGFCNFQPQQLLGP